MLAFQAIPKLYSSLVFLIRVVLQDFMGSQFVDVGKALVADFAEPRRSDALMYGPVA